METAAIIFGVIVVGGLIWFYQRRKRAGGDRRFGDSRRPQ